MSAGAEGLFRLRELRGDVVRGWNAPHKAIIGLLLLAGDRQRRGIGGAFEALVEARPATPPFAAEIVILEKPLARSGPAR